MGKIVKFKEAKTALAEVYVIDFVSVQLDHSVTIGLSLEIEGRMIHPGKADHPAMTCIFFNPFLFTKTILDQGLDQETNNFKQFIDGLNGVFVSDSSEILKSYKNEWLTRTPELDPSELMHYIIYVDGESISVISQEAPRILFAKSDVESLFAIRKK
ncbi:hypothetical protein [Litorimonas sp.]|uniref:hypothetical protein n=1 Tax=Litorimonas sp. TaxID=1892381 RepID=UPI003A8A88FA